VRELDFVILAKRVQRRNTFLGRASDAFDEASAGDVGRSFPDYS
jgi:hypothetical protein